MKKILVLTLCFLLLFSAVSCKKGDDTPEATTTATTTAVTTTIATTSYSEPKTLADLDNLEVGMKIKKGNGSPIFHDSVTRLLNVFMFENEDNKNVVVRLDSENTVIDIKKYEQPSNIADEAEKISAGMSVFEVVEKIGIPGDGFTSGFLSSRVSLNDGRHLTIYWDTSTLTVEAASISADVPA